MFSPNLTKLHDYRLIMLGARLMAQHVLSFNSSMSDWKLCRNVLECCIRDRESFANELFSPCNGQYVWQEKTVGKKKTKYIKKILPKDLGEQQMISLIDEWENIISGENK